MTGGIGCIGSTSWPSSPGPRPEHLVSVSRGRTVGWPQHPPAVHACRHLRPRQLAAGLWRGPAGSRLSRSAQRDPGLADREVQLTVGTNVPGTRNIPEACAEHGVVIMSCASSGKALRPYSREVYTATKRLGEWLLADAAPRTDVTISASRFTHIVDNPIAYGRLLSRARSGVIRLLDWSTLFCAQSAKESA